MEKSEPGFWQDILPGSTITLSDAQAISDSMERGEGVRGIDYIVESVWKVREEDALAEWLLFKLDAEDQELYLVAKIVDRDVELRVYFEPGEFEPGNRREIVERGDTWLFLEPENPEDFKFDELEFVPEIEWTVEGEDDGDERRIVYRRKGQGTLYGTCTTTPPLSGLGRMMATVVEYSTSQEFENPELMLLELGGEKGDEGGMITMMVGNRVAPGEVDVLKAAADEPVVRKKPSLWEKAIRRMAR